jgi:hypothetical protein
MKHQNATHLSVDDVSVPNKNDLCSVFQMVAHGQNTFIESTSFNNSSFQLVVKFILISNSEGAQFAPTITASIKAASTYFNAKLKLIVKSASDALRSEGAKILKIFHCLNSKGVQITKLIVVSVNSKIHLHFHNNCRIFCEGEWWSTTSKTCSVFTYLIDGKLELIELNPAFGHNLAFGHNMAFGVASGHNFASGPTSSHNLASGPAFGHNLASGPTSGPASGKNLASGPAFGHNELVKLITASGHNLASGLAFGHNELIELITCFGHNKLVKLIGCVGHTNGFISHNMLIKLITAFGHNKLINAIGHFSQIIGPKILTQLIVKLSLATNSEGTQVQSSKLIVGYHDSKIYLHFWDDCRIFVREYTSRSTHQE